MHSDYNTKYLIERQETVITVQVYNIFYFLQSFSMNQKLQNVQTDLVSDKVAGFDLHLVDMALVHPLLYISQGANM